MEPVSALYPHVLFCIRKWAEKVQQDSDTSDKVVISKQQTREIMPAICTYEQPDPHVFFCNCSKWHEQMDQGSELFPRNICNQ